jgi:uncharacterized protein YjbI with pentapeptide repeats
MMRLVRGLVCAVRRLWLLWLVAAVGLVAGLTLWAALVPPQWLLDTSVLRGAELAKARNDFRGTMLAALGGMAVIVGVIVGGLNLAHNRRVLEETQRQNRDTATQNRAVLELQRRGQVTERFSRAIEQLGQAAPDKLDVRIGAVFALEQIARDSPELHWPIMEVLTAYLREHARWVPQREVAPKESGEPTGSVARIPPDIQAIATVIGRRIGENDSPGEELELHGVDLRGVRWRCANLQNANLAGAHLEKGTLAEANLAHANLQRAHLQEANLWAANLEGADLEEAHLEAVSLCEANLATARLHGAHLTGAYLYEAHLERAMLAKLHRYGPKDVRMVVPAADLSNADLSRAHLEQAHLGGANLEKADCFETHLDGAVLFEANLKGADLTGACLNGANLAGAILSDVVGLTSAQLRVALNPDHVRVSGEIREGEGRDARRQADGD